MNQNTSGEDVDFEEGIVIEDKDIYIEGNNHIISGNDSNGNQVRIFNIIDSKVTLANLVLTSASSNGSGGAIYLPYGSDLILKNVTFRDNSALGIYGEGGALYARGHIFIYNCTFENNYASGAAGAIFARSTSYVDGSNLINNTAKWYGGGIFASYLMNITSCSFENNTAYSGAAFHYTLDYDDDNAVVMFYDCNFTGNVADDGAAFSTSTYRSAHFTHCNFIANRADRGAVMYKGTTSSTYFNRCQFVYNSANVGALFYQDSYEGDGYFPEGYISVNCSYLNGNVASDLASIFYSKSGNLRINGSVINNNRNNPIYNGKGYIIVTDSDILNYGSNFITQFLSGKIIVENNHWGSNNQRSEEIFNMSDASAILTEGDYNIESIMDSLNDIPYNSFDGELGECCSVYVRLNQTDYVLSQRRDGGDNFLLHVDKNKNYVKEFRPLGEYYFLSKVYSNGWVIGTGGWDDAAHNEKVEAIASDMALNECITMEALELIVDVKKINGVGHLLIVAPDGRWGNIITYSGRTYIGTGVLNDGEYIVSPNDPNYRQEGNLSYIGDVVEENINLSARDTYGYDRHCILAHHVVLSDFGIEDEVYVSNEDGRFINQSNAGCCDEFWFGEEYVSNYEIPIALDRLHLGTYYFSNRSIVSQNATVGYNGDYLFKVQLFDNNGDFLAYKQINVTVNGKANEYVTNKEGIIKIPFDKLTSSKNISLINPATGEWEVNSITVVSRIVGSNVVMDYFDGSKYTVKVYDSNGKPAGEGKTVTLKLNNKKYKIKTNSKGVASLTIPKTAIPKTYTLTATYGGQTIKNTVKIKQILKSADKTVKKSSKKAILKATLKTSKNKAIKGKWISFKFKGKTYKAKTNYKGIAKVTLNKKIINTLKAGKSYVLTVAYLKDNVKSTVKVRR